MIKKSKNQGFGLLEVVVGVSIISLVLFAVANVSGLAFKVREENTKNIQAAFLLEEGMEALRILRDSGWNSNISSLNTDTAYYLDFSNNNWHATSTNIYIDRVFERSFIVQNVNRDANDDISASGGTPDPTIKITFSVSWFSGNATTTKSFSTYLTNLFNN